MGAVCVLHNCSFPHLVKVGMTSGDPERRARELFSTGVPTRFYVLFAQPTEDPRALERAVHDALDEFRDSDNREFFRVSPRRAIEAVLAHAGFHKPPKQHSTTRDVTEALRTRMEPILAPDLIYAQINYAPSATTLVTKFGSGRDEKLSKADLEVIWDNEAPLFSQVRDADEAARAFVELDFATLVMITDLIAPVISNAAQAAHDGGMGWSEVGSVIDVALSADDVTIRSVLDELRQVSHVTKRSRSRR